MPDVAIRPARPSEFPAIGDLCVAAYAPFVAAGDGYAAGLRDVGRRAAAAEVLVAADGDALLGTVTFVPAGGPLGEIARPGETEFRMLAVDPRRAVASARRSSAMSSARPGGSASRASSARASPRCARPTACTIGWASDAIRRATGRRSRASS